eukprot:gene13572-20475_t
MTVHPRVVESLFRHSGKDGTFVNRADRDADKRELAVVPIPKDAQSILAAHAKVARCGSCTHGIVYTQRGLYARCRVGALDALRRELLGDVQAERLNCAVYIVDNVPPALTQDAVLEQLRGWVGGFPEHRILEP